MHKIQHLILMSSPWLSRVIKMLNHKLFSAVVPRANRYFSIASYVGATRGSKVDYFDTSNVRLWRGSNLRGNAVFIFDKTTAL